MPSDEKKTLHNAACPCEACYWDPVIDGGPYYHNSINNTKFPGPDPPPKCPSQPFTLAVHGMMTSPHFQHARRLAEILRQNIPHCCTALEIRTLMETDWYDYHAKIKRTHGGQVFGIKRAVACFVNDEFVGDDAAFASWVSKRFDIALCENYSSLAVREWNAFVDKSKYRRTLVYIEITIGSLVAGTLLFQLYDDLLPKTCDNFLRLCRKRKHGYSGRPIHRVVKDGWIQAGGTKLKSHKIPDEGNFVAHNRRGVLSMVKRGRHADNNTQFMVSLCPTPWMSPTYTAFGQLIDGEETLRRIESVPTHYERPRKRIVMARCGIYDRQCVLDEPKEKAVKHVKEHLAGDVENVNQTATYMRDIIVDNAMRIIKWKEQGQEAMDEEEESRVYEPSEEPSLTTITSICSCAIDECDVCGRVPSRDLYYPPHDIVDPRHKPSFITVEGYKNGWYFAETDLRTYLPPLWLRGLAHSDLTLSEGGKQDLCASVFQEVLQRMEMTPTEIYVRKILGTVLANVNQVMSEKRNFPNFAIVGTK